MTVSGRSLIKSVPGIRQVYRWRRMPHFHASIQDGLNRLRWGPDAPRFAECAWIDPMTVRWFDRKGTIWRSATVVSGNWDLTSQRPIEQDPVLRIASAHWIEGLSWEQAGEIERMEQTIARLGSHEGCRTRVDIVERCTRLDAMFETIAREGKLRTQAEVEPGCYREMGGIGMHFGPGGQPIRAGNGRHRFAIAMILGLKVIPVRVGAVHHSAIDRLASIRRAPPRN
jgi:hypothetical protein